MLCRIHAIPFAARHLLHLDRVRAVGDGNVLADLEGVERGGVVEVERDQLGIALLYAPGKLGQSVGDDGVVGPAWSGLVHDQRGGLGNEEGQKSVGSV